MAPIHPDALLHAQQSVPAPNLAIRQAGARVQNLQRELALAKSHLEFATFKERYLCERDGRDTVYRGGTQVAAVGGSTLTYSDTTVAASTTYSYTVDAFDAAGNHSAQSTAASVTTPAASNPRRIGSRAGSCPMAPLYTL